MRKLKYSTRSIIKNINTSELPGIHLFIEEATKLLYNCFERDKGKLLICGNGGSAGDAQHIVGELMKPFKINRMITPQLFDRFLDKNLDYLACNLKRALPAISLVGENSLISAIVNDMGSDFIFAQQVIGYGKPDDILLAISTSGNSKNIIYACETAKILGMRIIGLVGKTGGNLKRLCDIYYCVPELETYLIQEKHIIIYHAICASIENEIFGV